MRLLAIPAAMLQDLERGAPDLREAVAVPLRLHEDPEIDVHRRQVAKESTRWVITVHSDSVCEEVELDPRVSSALGPAIVLFLFTVIEELRRDHPATVHNVDLAGMMVALLTKLKEWAS
jgi:hypothetical protein